MLTGSRAFVLASSVVLCVGATGAASASGVDDLAKGRAALAAYKYDDAITAFTAALADKSLTPTDAAEAHVDRSTAYRRKRSFTEAIADANQAIRLVPGDAEAYADRSFAELSKGNSAGAAADANQAVTLDAKSPSAYLARANVETGARAFDKALADYAMALSFKPDDMRVYVNRGISYLNQAKWDLALADAAHADSLNPAPGWTDEIRGPAYLGKGDVESALRYYNRAIDAEPDIPYLVTSRANIELSQWHDDPAIDDATTALKLDPSHVAAYAIRAWAYYDKGDFARAVADIQQAATLAPHDPGVAKALGVITARAAAKDVTDLMTSAYYPARVAALAFAVPLNSRRTVAYGSWTLAFGDNLPVAQFTLTPQGQRRLAIGGLKCVNSVVGTVPCSVVATEGGNRRGPPAPLACALNIATNPPQAPIKINCPTSLSLAP